jgi:hypothetical protein
MTRVVGDEPDAGRPANPPGRIPEQEPPPRHPADAGDPGSRVAKDGDEAAEEDCLAAVLGHQPLGRGQEALGVAAQRPPALEQAAAPQAPDQPVAEVVADDRAGRGYHDHPDDRVVPLRGEHAEGDQRGLSGQRDPERLE